MHWDKLHVNLGRLPSSLVSLTLVPEIFCPLSQEMLATMFDIVRPLRQHHLIELGRCQGVDFQSTTRACSKRLPPWN
jgi:hypothetical protein